MYGTGSLLIWVVVAVAEFCILLAATWMNLCIPKRCRESIRSGHHDNWFEGAPVKVIHQRFRINWPFIGQAMAFGTVIVFAVMNYSRLMQICFDGLWFGHIAMAVGLFIIYVFLTLFLILAILAGTAWKKIYLKKYIWERFHVSGIEDCC